MKQHNQLHTHRARKRFGQNFLHSQSIIQGIIMALDPQSTDKVVEIGPGLGALTKPLLDHLPHLIAIEIDRDLHAHLMDGSTASSRLELIQADALTVDYRQWGAPIRLVGNLPYNISTPLIFHLLEFVDCIQDMHFMVQKEVAERLVAMPGSKQYGRLSIMVQICCDVELLLDVPPESFSPAPKVDSAVICLRPYHSSPYPTVDRHLLREVVARAFGMRRKTLANNFRNILTAEELSSININPTARPEQITINDYVRLANFLRESCKM